MGGADMHEMRGKPARVRGGNAVAHNDINDAKATYESFIGTAKISMVVIALVTAFVVIIIQ